MTVDPLVLCACVLAIITYALWRAASGVRRFGGWRPLLWRALLDAGRPPCEFTGSYSKYKCADDVGTHRGHTFQPKHEVAEPGAMDRTTSCAGVHGVYDCTWHYMPLHMTLHAPIHSEGSSARPHCSSTGRVGSDERGGTRACSLVAEWVRLPAVVRHGASRLQRLLPRLQARRSASSPPPLAPSPIFTLSTLASTISAPFTLSHPHCVHTLSIDSPFHRLQRRPRLLQPARNRRCAPDAATPRWRAR